MTHCRRGHELTPENVYTQANGTRRCRTCKLAATHRLRSDPDYRERERQQQHERYHSTDPETHRKVSAEYQRHNLSRRRRRLEAKRLTQGPITPFGEVVRSAINQLGDQAWRDIERRMK